jgi:heme exporter protein A
MTIHSACDKTSVSTVLSARGLACVRGERRLFSGIDLRVGAGEWLHVRGENGVGKTSLLRLLAGLSKPAEGEIAWQGQPIQQAAEEYRRHLFYLGHHDAVKEELTALENLDLAAELDGRQLRRGEGLAALERFGLKGREDLPVRCLSAGQKRRVLLARLVTRKAQLWLLDEPFAALDAKAVALLSDLVGAHIAAGGMAVMTSHQPIAIPDGLVLQL